MERSTPANGQRAIHLIDTENLVGGPGATSYAIRRAWDTYRAAVPIGPRDHVIVASSSYFAKKAMFEMAGPGVQLRVRDGKDGAELALMDAVDIEHAARRFGQLVIASGDGIFTDLALRARDLGMQVHEVIGVGTPSRKLMAACPQKSWLRLGNWAARAAMRHAA
jgi:hypothetical protein